MKRGRPASRAGGPLSRRLWSPETGLAWGVRRRHGRACLCSTCERGRAAISAGLVIWGRGAALADSLLVSRRLEALQARGASDSLPCFEEVL